MLEEENIPEPKRTTVEKNDWVRYYDKENNLRIGCVTYIFTKDNGETLLALENGIVPASSVIEFRREHGESIPAIGN